MNDDMKPKLPPNSVTPKKKLYPVAKIKARGKTRHIAVQRMGNTPMRIRERVSEQPEASISRSVGNGEPQLTVKSFKGNCAPYNDHANTVQDPFNAKVYVIGGIRPSDDENWEPTSDFFCYDTRTMEWENLTDRLTYRDPYDPYSRMELQRQTKPLPRRSQPGCTLWRHANISFIFIFGGCDLETTIPSSQVIIVNLQAREWWYERFDRVPLPRIDPAIVAIQDKVYIFGGYRSYEEDPQACYSYSIAEWNATPQGSRWSFVEVDVPYPPPLSQTTCIGQAISVYEGKVIFLAPGRTNGFDDREIAFTDKSLFYFRLRDHSFLPVPIMGDPPRNIQWYSIFDLQSVFNHTDPPPPSIPSSSANSGPAPPRKRGRPRKYPLVHDSVPSSVAAVITKPPTSSQRPPPSVVICAWLSQPSNGDAEQESADEKIISPEIYRFDFHPEDMCKSLNLKAKISGLNRDFQGCAYVTPGYLCLLGNHQAGESDDRMETDSDSDNEVDKTWNIYLDVPIDV